MLDDKAAIGLGPPGTPVSATRRQRLAIQSGVELNSCDHDHTVQHLTPSVSIKMNAPSNAASPDWYGGLPTVILKDSIFEPSHAFRHITEIDPILADDPNPFLFGITDGGPDHNTLGVRNQLALITLFLKGKYDYLCFVRTPPHYSTLNPTERLMCVINLALNGVALCRESVGENEKFIRHLTSKVMWREQAKKHPNLDIPKLARDGAASAIELLTKRISEMSYKGEPIVVREPASEDEISAMKQVLSIFFTDEEFANLMTMTKAQLMKIKKFKDFFDVHCRVTQYGFQAKKCNNMSCECHDWIRVPMDIYNQLHWLPSPELNKITKKYKDFDEVYGNEPNDQDRPGRKESTECTKKPTGWQIATQRARLIVRCSQCNYPRVLFTKNKLSQKERLDIDEYFEDNYYSCGDEIDFEHIGVQEIFSKNKLYCSAQISAQYYQLAHLEGFELICSICLSEEVPPQNAAQPKCVDCLKKA